MKVTTGHARRECQKEVPKILRPARREILTQNGLVKGDRRIQTHAGRSPTRACLSQGPLLHRPSKLLSDPCPAKAKSVRQFVIPADLEPPQTTTGGRRAGSWWAHRRQCRTEIPATGNTMLLRITYLYARLVPSAPCLLLAHGSWGDNYVFFYLTFPDWRVVW